MVTCTENLVKFGRFRNMRANRQTNRHTDQNTSHLYCGEVNTVLSKLCKSDKKIHDQQNDL